MKLLAIRDPHKPLFFEILVDHFRVQLDIALDVRSLLDPMPKLKDFDLVAFWLLDPLDNRPGVYSRACALASLCAQEGVPVFQHPAALPNARKSAFSAKLREAHIPCLRVARVSSLNVPLMTPPLFIRDDVFHSGGLHRADRTCEVSAAIEAAVQDEEIKRPVAVEFIETMRGGLYRKYRYVVAGDAGVPLHLQISPDWITRGDKRLFTQQALDAEKSYIARGTNPLLQQAAKVLGFDYCAFDYTYDGNSQLVLWEVNPAPVLHWIKRYKDMDDGRRLDLQYRNEATQRALDALTAAYRARAGV